MAPSDGENSSRAMGNDFGSLVEQRAADPGARRGVIHEAAVLLQARHHIREMSAYELLIAAAVQSHRNVRDTACSIIAESRRESTLI